MSTYPPRTHSIQTPVNGRRERLWLSPACLEDGQQLDIFGGVA